MAKFKVRKTNGNSVTVEADDYYLKDGYFWFHDDQQSNVHTLRASDVVQVELEKQSKPES